MAFSDTWIRQKLSYLLSEFKLLKANSLETSVKIDELISELEDIETGEQALYLDSFDTYELMNTYRTTSLPINKYQIVVVKSDETDTEFTNPTNSFLISKTSVSKQGYI